ncbi:MAG: ABC transporter permease [Flavobacteriales bacterium]|nr:ABC transporter permease [Flavobacteriales bacterium]
MNKSITTTIKPNRGLFDIQILEIWSYRDLLWLLIKRDFTVFYKQTILGPFWFFIQPLLSTIVFTIIFNKVAGISTDGTPPNLFYMSGIIAWNYFSGCLSETSNVFNRNAGLFGKVYFPRIVVPLSIVISKLTTFFVQSVLLLILHFYYSSNGDLNYHFDYSYIVLLPIMILQMAILGLGLGSIISSLTVKYRDLGFLLGFGTQLLMYACPIVYPLTSVPENYKSYIQLNPMTPIIIGFRKIFTGEGQLVLDIYLLSIFTSVFIFFIGLIIFSKVEKNFIDTI